MSPYLQTVRFKAFGTEWVYSHDGLKGDSPYREVLEGMLNANTSNHTPLTVVLENVIEIKLGQKLEVILVKSEDVELPQEGELI